MAREWESPVLVRTLQEMRGQEQIPVSVRRQAIRAQLMNDFQVRLCAFETQLGWMGVAETARGICGVKLPRPSRDAVLHSLQSEFPTGRFMDRLPGPVVSQLCDFAEGKRATFDVPVDLSALKPFQLAVLRAIRDIPYGETRSYGWVAQEIGKPHAARAVGQALAKNPVPIIIPCHRIISGDNRLGGYAGGLDLKQRLLELEGAVHTSTR